MNEAEITQYITKTFPNVETAENFGYTFFFYASERKLPFVTEPLLDDIDVGDLEGETLEAYRAWKHSHAREVPFPGGESLDDAALRYAQAFRRLLKLPHDTMLAITHEIPIRYALNGAGGSDSLDGPAHEVENAVAYLFDDEALARAADGIETIVAG